MCSKGIDLTVLPVLAVILGPSGSGKSFRRLINQLETLTGGSIEVGGELISYKHVTKSSGDMQTWTIGNRRTALSPRHGVPALQPVPTRPRWRT